MHSSAKHLAILAALACGFAGATSASAAPGGMVVPIDEGRSLTLSGAAAQVIIANPSIADATIINRHQLMLLGKGYGSTSLIVIDAAGRTIYNGAITVSGSGANHVSLYRGVVGSTYACTSARCERTATAAAAAPAASAGTP